MKLGEKQELFTELQAILILYMRSRGYRPRLKFVKRCQDCPIGIDGCHQMSLAEDIDLFDSEGNYLTETEDHREFGEFWKKLHPLCRWGGDFSNVKDGNHYSITHNGKA